MIDDNPVKIRYEYRIRHGTPLRRPIDIDASIRPTVATTTLNIACRYSCTHIVKISESIVDVNEPSKGSQASSSKIYGTLCVRIYIRTYVPTSSTIVHIGIDGFTCANFTAE